MAVTHAVLMIVLKTDKLSTCQANVCGTPRQYRHVAPHTVGDLLHCLCKHIVKDDEASHGCAKGSLTVTVTDLHNAMFQEVTPLHQYVG